MCKFCQKLKWINIFMRSLDDILCCMWSVEWFIERMSGTSFRCNKNQVHKPAPYDCAWCVCGVVAVPPCLIIEPPIPVCFQPSPDNITAKISSNSVSKIELTWTPSVKPTNGSCKLKYCTGSRQYKVKMLVFNSVPLDSTVEPDYETGWLKVRRRRAFYTFRDANISPEKFFMFKVRNRRRHGTVTTPTSPYMNDVTRTKCSRVFYFGNQSK